MYNSISDLPEKAIVDTNVWLEACLNPDSIAIVAFRGLRTLGFVPVIDAKIYGEATRILQQYAAELGVTGGVGWIFDRWLKGNGIPIHASPRDPPPLPSVNKNDQHIAQAAVHHNGWVLTGDTFLFGELLEDGLTARWPMDVVGQAPGIDPMQCMFRALSFGQDEGSLFIRCRPHSNCAGESAFTLLDVENLGRLFFGGQEQGWCFRLINGRSVCVKVQPLEAGEEEILLVNYRWGGDGGKFQLRVRSEGSDTAELPELQEADAPGTITPLDSRDRTSPYSGTLACCVGSWKQVDKKRWKKLRSLPNAAPNPFDENQAKSSLANLLAHLTKQPPTRMRTN